MAPRTPIGEFNKEYFEFLNFIKNHIDDTSFKTFYRKNQIIKETNPKLFIRTWYDCIGSKYHLQVMQKDISFFLNKEYENDVIYAGSDSNMLLKYINKFKESYESLDETIKETFLNFIIGLTDKSFVYYK
jgi:hypothetical protein